MGINNGKLFVDTVQYLAMSYKIADRLQGAYSQLSRDTQYKLAEANSRPAKSNP
jgi:hypothetical protein